MEWFKGRLIDHVRLAAFVFYPDDNIEAVFHNPADRSTEAVVITPAAPRG